MARGDQFQGENTGRFSAADAQQLERGHGSELAQRQYTDAVQQAGEANEQFLQEIGQLAEEARQNPERAQQNAEQIERLAKQMQQGAEQGGQSYSLQ